MNSDVSYDVMNLNLALRKLTFMAEKPFLILDSNPYYDSRPIPSNEYNLVIE